MAKKIIYTKEKLIEIIRKRAEELGRPPRSKELKQYGTIFKRFGSFRNALISSGLSLDFYYKEYSDEMLLNIIRKRAKELGRVPKIHMVEKGSTISRRFGGWGNALNKAGLGPYKYKKDQSFSNQQLIEEIRKKSKELGRLPKYNELKRYRVIIRRFKSLENAFKTAGIKKKFSD